MALIKEFDCKLNELWARRTTNIRSLIRTHHGRRREFTKTARERGIQELQALATQILTKRGARDELDAITRFRRRKHLRGRGIKARFERIFEWARDNFHGPIIYTFWKGRRCLYVGKGKDWCRLRGYRKSIYMREATSIVVRVIKSPSYLAKAECLMIHVCEPRDNAVKAARGRHKKKCPICQAHRQIKDELRAMFRMR